MLAAHFGGKIEAIRRQYSGDQFLCAFGTLEGMSDLVYLVRCHSIGKDTHYILAKGRVGRRKRQELLSCALIESRGMHFIPADAPPTGQNCGNHALWHDLPPDKGLDVLGRAEFSFGSYQ